MNNYNNILVAIDFSKAADIVIQRALDIARRNNTGLTLLHVVEYIPPMDIAYEPVMTSTWAIDENELIEQAQKNMEKFCKLHKLEQNQHKVVVGTPKYEICQFVRENHCDLIILGAQGRHGIKLLLGSTASGVLHEMPCDVLAVKIKE